MLSRAPVSVRTRRCATVTRAKMISATALPIDAIARQVEEHDEQHDQRRRRRQQPDRRAVRRSGRP